LEQDGKPAGTVFIAVAGAKGVQVWEEHFSGDRAGIRTKTVEAALFHIREYFSK
jgi:nicotinamide-nucleotide amidase